ncbi:hypothetical protein GW17_00053232 [Ensete ventricosum]|nr:hypothetical protein GW17_00053232 [Ensete ventricosum]
MRDNRIGRRRRRMRWHSKNDKAEERRKGSSGNSTRRSLSLRERKFRGPPVVVAQRGRTEAGPAARYDSSASAAQLDAPRGPSRVRTTPVALRAAEAGGAPCHVDGWVRENGGLMRTTPEKRITLLLTLPSAYSHRN